MADLSAFHPELRDMARRIPRFSFNGLLAGLARLVFKLRGVPKPPDLDDVEVRDISISRPDGGTPLRIRLYSPKAAAAPRPAMLWVHGGGFIMGSPEQDQANNIALCRELGMVIAAVAYRLTPKHPFPAPLDDCYTALRWLHDEAEALGVDRGRIVVGGNSAGGGLAAGLVLMAHARREVPVAFQLLVYPMIDDRAALRTDIDETRLRLWTGKSNRYGWQSYLNTPPGSLGISPYAAPARRADLSGLPPAWIGVGTCDLFHDEDVDYARRLEEAGVPCTLTVVEGAFHGFDLVRDAAVVREFRASYVQAMIQALNVSRQAAAPAVAGGIVPAANR